ncbi:hypothetical protein Lalb_Chr16g0390571 [Lupinus albus]|uniref:Uncharacterized protein n=1 Tax=Lupinus albus TaxID=3870 RepID=A0A6A4P838_LUPAL|nr:hypothetical protein Lalb_Chr16g0390571 [Lupinus albus]
MHLLIPWVNEEMESGHGTSNGEGVYSIGNEEASNLIKVIEVARLEQDTAYGWIWIHDK